MGVEYRHFLVPARPDWLPHDDLFTRVDALLRKWSLVAGEPKIFDLSGGNQVRLSQLPTAANNPGVAVVYPMVEHVNVARLFGPSYYPEIADRERYIEGITVIAGMDFRVHASNEAICFTVVRPPYECGREVEPYAEGKQRLFVHAECYPATAATTPPEVEIQIEESAREKIAFSGFSGFWRGALVLDCGKNLPAYVDGAHRLKSVEFIAEVAEVFGSRMYEIGEIY